MKNSYPIIMSPDKVGYVVYIPDFDINTEGDTLTEAIEMARDAISLMGVDMMEDHKELPSPTELSHISKENDNDIITLVDVDFEIYKKKLDNRAVKKNCTIPSWLNELAEKEHINFSAVLREALESRLNIR